MKTIILTKILIISLIFALIGNTLDLITTYVALNKNGNYEQNPTMSYVIKNWGWFSFFLIKLLVNYLFLPLKYNLIYATIQKIINGDYKIKNFYLTLLIITFLYVGYIFCSASFSNFFNHII